MGVVLGIYNRKGGIGKTTTCFSMAGQYAVDNKSVLVLDIDSQINLTANIFRNDPSVFYDYNNMKEDVPTIYDVLTNGVPAENAILTLDYDKPWYKMVKAPGDPKPKRIQGTASCSFDVIPGSKEMVYFSSEDPTVLKAALEPIKDQYDYILIDFPPTFNITTLTGLVACDYVVVPLRILEPESEDGYSDLIDRISEARDWGSDVEVLGVFYNTVHRNWTTHKELLKLIKEQPQENASGYFSSSIRLVDSTIASSKSAGMPLCIFAPHDPITKDFKELCDEVEKRIKERRNG